MITVPPSVRVYFHVPRTFDGAVIEPQVFLELVGRTCYKSEDKITAKSAPKFIHKLKERGHHAMLEHCVASVCWICDRGVSHELVRHRIAAWAQESTRFCNYSLGKFGGQITVIDPPEKLLETDNVCSSVVLEKRHKLFEEIEKHYMWELDKGIAPQIARGVLPQALKTEIWITANLREWLHIFSLRLEGASGPPHPQMRQLMSLTYPHFAKQIPELYPGFRD